MPATTHDTRDDGRALRWRGQHERRRAEFVDAALRAIAEHGPSVSTERIAEHAGVARTRLYKHFTDAADLQRTIADRVRELLVEELEPVWNPAGTPAEMISTAVRTHLTWMIEHGNLHHYLIRHSIADDQQDGVGRAGDVRTAIGLHLSRMFTGYLTQFGLDPSPAETVAFGVVGYVESATARWLDHNGATGRDALVRQLTSAIWAVLDHTLRAGGVRLDPDQPLPPLAAERGRR